MFKLNSLKGLPYAGDMPRPGTAAFEKYTANLPKDDSMPRPGTAAAKIWAAAHPYKPVAGDMPRPGTENFKTYMNEFHPGYNYDLKKSFSRDDIKNLLDVCALDAYSKIK